MLEKLLKLYVMYMALDVRSPVPHMFGPPGSNKSTVAQQLADLVGTNLHIINVSRLSPLEVEGVQMPTDMHDPAAMRLHMLTATFWTSLKEGDVVLLDEFLRGFPEVYNALLDILTSRRVGGFVLPKVFIVAASNSTVAYDKALEDRLLHIPVADPRKSKRAKAELAEAIVSALGLLPSEATSTEMNSLLDTEVLPMYDMLDQIKGKGSSAPANVKGRSIRNLIGQAQLREIHTPALAELIKFNNVRAMQQGKPQYVVLPSGKAKDLPANYEQEAQALVGNTRLTEQQALNLQLNLQLIELEANRNQKGDEADDVFVDDTQDDFTF
jgi:hypothetical protein